MIENLRKQKYKIEYERALDRKIVEDGEVNDAKQMQEPMKLIVAERGKEIWGLSRIGRKNPKREKCIRRIYRDQRSEL